MTEKERTLTIHSIDTRPVHDPYTNIAGIVSKTYLKLDPRDMTVWVAQEYADNSTPIEEYNRLVLAWLVFDHPLEDAMSAWIESNMGTLLKICAGYEVEWDGNRHIGALSSEAHTAYEAIESELSNDGPSPFYEFWAHEEWVGEMARGIKADTTDEILRDMAQAAIAALDAGQLLDKDEDGIYEYLRQMRDDLKDE